MYPDPTDWPTFQVDTHNSGSHPTAIGPAGPVEVRWRREIDAPWSTSPIVVNGTLYAGTHAPALHAIDPATGDDRWTFSTPENVTDVAVRGDRVYVGNAALPRTPSRTGFVGGRTDPTDPLHVIDADDGRCFDSRSIDGEVSGVDTDGEALFCSCRGDDLFLPSVVSRLDAATLETEWSVELSGLERSGPVFSGETVWFGDYENTVTAIDADTGEVRWTARCAETVADDGVPPEVTALAGTDDLVLALCDGSLHAFDVDTGEKRWAESPTGRRERYRCHPVVDGDAVYVATSEAETLFRVLDRTTGEPMRECAAPETIDEGLTLVDGSLYAAIEAEEPTVAAIDLETGQRRWSYTFGLDEFDKFNEFRPVGSPPIVVDGRAYLRVYDTLFALADR